MRRGRLLLAVAAGAATWRALSEWQRMRSANESQDPFAWSESPRQPGRALITGASSGIGATFAQHLAASGFDLVLVARREARLAEVASALQAAHGVQVETIVADLTQEAEVQRVVNRIQKLDDLDLLVNDAGFGTTGRFAKSKIDRQVDMIQVHNVATARLTRAALPGMVARHRGAIINVASVMAFVPLPGGVMYAATKAFLLGFSEALEMELRGSGVRVQALCPGFTVTEFHDSREFAHDARAGIPGFMWLSADQVVEESLAALRRDEVVCVPGLQYRAIAVLARNSLLSWPLRLIGGRMDGLKGAPALAGLLQASRRSLGRMRPRLGVLTD